MQWLMALDISMHQPLGISIITTTKNLAFPELTRRAPLLRPPRLAAGAAVTQWGRHTTNLPNVWPMSAHRRRRWADIGQTLGRRVVFLDIPHLCEWFITCNYLTHKRHGERAAHRPPHKCFLIEFSSGMVHHDKADNFIGNFDQFPQLPTSDIYTIAAIMLGNLLLFCRHL